MSTQKETLNCELQNNALKQRIEYLMTPEEKEKPYSFATRVGLSKGTFTGIWVNGRNSLHQSTINKISKATGANAGWIATGEGEPYTKSVKVENSQFPLPSKKHNYVLDTEMLKQCYESTEGALYATFRLMDSDQKAELISQFYVALLEENNKEIQLDVETLLLSIFTLEVSLFYSRQRMSSKNKTQLIASLYDSYHSNTEMKSTILEEYNQYKRSHGDERQ